MSWQEIGFESQSGCMPRPKIKHELHCTSYSPLCVFIHACTAQTHPPTNVQAVANMWNTHTSETQNWLPVALWIIYIIQESPAGMGFTNRHHLGKIRALHVPAPSQSGHRPLLSATYENMHDCMCCTSTHRAFCPRFHYKRVFVAYTHNSSQ